MKNQFTNPTFTLQDIHVRSFEYLFANFNDFFHNQLKGLKSLRLLVRGDFLCEALEVLKDETGDQIPPLAIEEFWASEDYYFHDAQQVSSFGQMSITLHV